VNDSGLSRSAKAIFKIKTFTICKMGYNHDNTSINPVDHQAKEVVNKYNLKFKKLDAIFASDIVEDGSNNIMGPF
jgi:hypothetical protein